MRSVASSHSGRYSEASRVRVRRWASALGSSAAPASATVHFSRVAVSASCKALRERMCISALLLATMGSPVRSATRWMVDDSRASCGRRSSGSAMAARSAPSNQVFSHIAWAKTVSKGWSAEGTSKAVQPGRPASIGAVGTLPSTSLRCARY